MDDSGDSEPQQSAIPRSPPELFNDTQSGSVTPVLTEVESSLSSLSLEESRRSVPKTGAIHPVLTTPLGGESGRPLFSIEQLGVDRRLIVNRKRQLKMYRVWVQGKFKKT